MSKDNVIDLKKPESFVDDPITDILRQGARKLLAQALETEVEIFINNYKELTLTLHKIVNFFFCNQAAFFNTLRKCRRSFLTARLALIVSVSFPCGRLSRPAL